LLVDVRYVFVCWSTRCRGRESRDRGNDGKTRQQWRDSDTNALVEIQMRVETSDGGEKRIRRRREVWLPFCGFGGSRKWNPRDKRASERQRKGAGNDAKGLSEAEERRGRDVAVQ
jgi:hypothetical protein